MHAVVPAAGEGTRLRPRTAEKPKPLVEVAGKPLLSYCFETVIEVGIDEAVVVVGYEGDRICERYGGSYRDLSIEYVRQPERQGLAHAVLMARSRADGEFVVLNGDNVYDGNLAAVVDAHRAGDADVTIPVHEVSREAAWEGAVCVFDDASELVGLVEKPEDPPSRYAPAACYVLPQKAFVACELVRPSARGEYELADAVDLLLDAGYAVGTVLFEGRKVNVNTETDRERAEALVAGDRG
jgi:glucose-1-phosphate thymidylyltransferase